MSRLVTQTSAVEAEVVQLAHHPRADVAEPDDDDVAAGRARRAAQRAGQPGADGQRGDHRDERHAVDGEDRR